MSKQSETSASGRELVTRRTFNAPRELVYQAWTAPRHLTHWWGPRGFRTTTHEMDLRPGGTWRFDMIGPDGTVYPNRVVYQEVVPAERLVYEHRGEGDYDHILFQASVTFTERDGQTEVTLRSEFATAEELERVVRENGAKEGAVETLTRLGEYIEAAAEETMFLAEPDQPTIVISRLFDAPRELVFEATSQREHVRQWWGCGMSEMTVCDIDFRVGGRYRYELKAPDGTVHPFCGEYLEIDAPARVVHTEIYDVDEIRDLPMHCTATFDDEGGKTRLTVRIVHQSLAARDGHLGSGMKHGVIATYDRLAEYLGELQEDDEVFLLQRQIDAPRERVYEAWTRADLLQRWWAPKGFTNPECEVDPRVGGSYRIVMQSPDGEQYPIKGSYLEIVPNEKLVMGGDTSEHPEEWHEQADLKCGDGGAADDAVSTITFDDLGGRTKPTLRTRFISGEVKRQMLAMGMRQGWSESWDKLEELLAGVAAGS